MLPAFAWIVALAASLPVAVLTVECLVGLIPRRYAAGSGVRQAAPPFVVLMPAHDEERGLAPVIAAVLEQLRPCDELLVIADNCTDRTAAIGRSMGATVVEREDRDRRGKGHALEFGREFLASTPSLSEARVIIVLDADCMAERGSLPMLAAQAAAGAVVQGAYLMEPPPQADAVVRVSCFAFLVKNLVRQRGLDRISGLALLQGSGMAFPRAVFDDAGWASASLVEDLDMGLQLLLAGHRTTFLPAARFSSAASSRQGTVGQRKRWEHGAMQTALRFAPRLLAAAIRQRRCGLVAVALDLLVPPTALLVLLLAAAICMLAMLTGLSAPLVFLLGAAAVLALALLAAWWRHARAMVPLASLLRVPGYLLWKMPLLAQFVTRRERAWLRTERNP